MSSEITRQDRAKNTDKPVQHLYGRGSKVKLRALGDIVFILLNNAGEYWSVANEWGRMEEFHEENIEKVLVDGHWLNFDLNPKKWKKVR